MIKRIERIRKSVVSRVLANGKWGEPDEVANETSSLLLSGHMMRHLFYLTRMRQQRILEQIIDPRPKSSINNENPWW